MVEFSTSFCIIRMPRSLVLGAVTVAGAAGAAVAYLLRRRSRTVLSSRQAIKLTYLDAKSSGEPIRLALFISGVPFEDRRVTYASIARLRDEGYLPFGQVPALEVDGQVYAQSQAILRWVGWHTGLYPADLQLQMDMIDEAIFDVKYVLRPAWYGAALGRHPGTGEPLLPLDAAQRAATIEALNDVVLPKRLAQLEGMLVRASDGPYVCGARMTIADLNLYVFASGVLDGSGVPPGISTELLRGCPRIRALVEHIEAHPKVAEWNRRPTTPPIFEDGEQRKTVSAF